MRSNIVRIREITIRAAGILVASSLALAAVTSCASLEPKFRDGPYAASIEARGDCLSFRCGEKRVIDGVPFLKLAGTHREMGLQFGALMERELKESLLKVLEMKRAVEAYAPAIARPFVQAVFFDPIAEKVRSRLPPEYISELEGMAEGAGTEFRDLLLMAGGNGVLEFACASVLSRSSGSILLGRNLDWAPGWQGSYPVAIEYRPEGGKRYFTVGVMLYPMACLTGLNEDGVALSLDIVSCDRNPDSRCVPVYMLMRQVLEGASTLDDVETAFSSYRTDIGWILSAASGREGKGAAFELATDGVAVRRLDADGAVFSLNSFADPTLAARHEAIGQPNALDNDLRADSLRAALGRGAPADLGSMRVLLDARCPFAAPGYRSLGDVNHAGSLQTVLIDPLALRVEFSSERAYSAWGRFLSYDLRTGAAGAARTELPEMAKAEGTVGWYSNFFLDLYGGRGAGIVREIEKAGIGASVDAESLVQIYRFNAGLVPVGTVVEALKKTIADNQGVCAPMVDLGELLAGAGRYGESIAAFENALVSPSVKPWTALRSHSGIAEARIALGDGAGAAVAAGRALALMDGMKGRLAEADAERALRARMERLAGK